jgi:ethanolamine utilization protein EutQ (cupin superfamily)
MARRFFTEADIRRLVKDEGRSELVLEPTDVLTALALDAARELGLRLINHEPTPAWSAAGKRETLLRGPQWEKPAAEAPPLNTEDLVARIVSAVLQRVGSAAGGSPNAAAAQAAGLHDISVISGRPTEPAPLVPGATPALELRQQEAIGPADGSPLRAGFCSWRAGAREVILAQAEIHYVVEGLLEITVQGQTRRVFAGDAALLPGGVALQLTTPTWVKVFYVGF